MLKRLKQQETKSQVVVVKMPVGMYQQVMEKSKGKYLSVQDYIRHLILKDLESTEPVWSE